jgi:hypothetical protein
VIDWGSWFVTFLGVVGIVLLWRAGPLVFPEMVPWRRQRPTQPDGDSDSDSDGDTESDDDRESSVASASDSSAEDVNSSGDADPR